MQKRVKSKEELLLYLIEVISQKPDNRKIIAIDGKSGSGKTYFSEFLTQNIKNSTVVHMDDFYLPFEHRAKNWKEIPTSNMDFNRLLSEIIKPFLKGENPEYIAFNPHKNETISKGKIASKILIIEGSYSEHPLLSSYYFEKIFLDISDEIQMTRLQKREGDNFEKFYSLWVRLENEYFAKYQIKEKADITFSVS